MNIWQEWIEQLANDEKNQKITPKYVQIAQNWEYVELVTCRLVASTWYVRVWGPMESGNGYHDSLFRSSLKKEVTVTSPARMLLALLRWIPSSLQGYCAVTVLSNSNTYGCETWIDLCSVLALFPSFPFGFTLLQYSSIKPFFFTSLSAFNIGRWLVFGTSFLPTYIYPKINLSYSL